MNVKKKKIQFIHVSRVPHIFNAMVIPQTRILLFGHLAAALSVSFRFRPPNLEDLRWCSFHYGLILILVFAPLEYFCN